jgi:outer membrane lipoprotein-sorting protein
MQRFGGILAVIALLGAPALGAASGPTADEIIANYVKTIGGMEKLEAIKTLKKTGRYTSGGGLEAKVVEESKRPDLVRQEFVLQGMTGITAWDGKTGWKIEPWQGKKDVEPLGEEELKQILEDADFDGPLVNYKQKGNAVELVGTEPVEGTDAYKLKVTLKAGDVQYFFMDTDYFVPIKIEKTRVVRGAPRESETSIGDYKKVAGVYFPHSFESGQKGSANRAKVVYDKVEANVPLDDSRFHPSAGPGK